MLCPICTVDLVVADRQGIEIDYCPKCRGVWLDRGELDKIIERTSVNIASAVQTRTEPVGMSDPSRDKDYRKRDWDDDDDDDYYRRTGKKRKKSVWSEIFDF